MFADNSINFSTINRMGKMVDEWFRKQEPNCLKYGSCNGRCGEPCTIHIYAGVSASMCQCDHLCTNFGDCCADYWYHCKRKEINHFHNLVDQANNTQLGVMNAILQDNSLSSFLKYYIYHNYQYQKPKNYYHYIKKYMSCEAMTSKEPVFHIYTVDKCPQGSPKGLKKKCEEKTFSTFSPVYNTTLGTFRNGFCVECHGLNVSDFIPWEISFDCGYKIPDEVVDSGNMSLLSEILFDKCDFMVEVYESYYTHSLTGIEQQLKRQHCERITNFQCGNCSIFCVNFKFQIKNPILYNPFENECSLENLSNMTCPGRSSKFMFHQTYSLLFSLNENKDTSFPVGVIKFRGKTSKYKFDIFCQGSKVIDILNHTCIDFDELKFSDVGQELYIPKLDNMPKIETVAITNDTVKDSLIEYRLKVQKGLSFSQSISCNDTFIKAYDFFMKHSKSLPPSNKPYCVHDQREDSFVFTMEEGKSVFYKETGVPYQVIKEILIFNVDVDSSIAKCHGSDELVLLDVNAFNVSGDVKLAVVFNGLRYIVMLDGSSTVVRITRNCHKIEMEISTLLCRKMMQVETDSTANISTIVGISVSLLFLLLTITIIVLLMRSFKIKKKVTTFQAATDLVSLDKF